MTSQNHMLSWPSPYFLAALKAYNCQDSHSSNKCLTVDRTNILAARLPSSQRNVATIKNRLCISNEVSLCVYCVATMVTLRRGLEWITIHLPSSSSLPEWLIFRGHVVQTKNNVISFFYLVCSLACVDKDKVSSLKCCPLSSLTLTFPRSQY